MEPPRKVTAEYYSENVIEALSLNRWIDANIDNGYKLTGSGKLI